MSWQHCRGRRATECSSPALREPVEAPNIPVTNSVTRLDLIASQVGPVAFGIGSVSLLRDVTCLQRHRRGKSNEQQASPWQGRRPCGVAARTSAVGTRDWGASEDGLVRR